MIKLVFEWLCRKYPKWESKEKDFPCQIEVGTFLQIKKKKLFIDAVSDESGKIIP